MDKFSKTNTQNKQKENDTRDKGLYIEKLKKEHLNEVGDRLKAEATRINVRDKKEANRHNKKERSRVSILADHSLERMKKNEGIRLKNYDVLENQWREK